MKKNICIKKTLFLILFLVLPNKVMANTESIDTTILFPIRSTFESLNYSVDWNSNDNSIKIHKNDKSFSFHYDNNLHSSSSYITFNDIAYGKVQSLNELDITYKLNPNSSLLIANAVTVNDNLLDLDPKVIEQLGDEIQSPNNKLIFFWASWCPHCKEYIREIKKYVDENPNSEIQFLGINIDNKNDFDLAQTFIDESLDEIVNIFDFDKEIYNSFTPRGIPTTFVIDKNGNIVNIVEGTIKKSDFVNLFNKSN